jgi:hypothetical protein
MIEVLKATAVTCCELSAIGGLELIIFIILLETHQSA